MARSTEKFVNSQDIAATRIFVWDLLVRIGHWLLVLLFFVAYLTEDDLLTLHSWAGYGVGVYVVIRFIWGFVGPKHARFADFAYGPVAAAHYLWDLMRFQAARHIGHSPAGGLMVFALLISLTGTTVSGIALLAVEENAGPLAPWLASGVAFQNTMQAPSWFAVQARELKDRDERDEDHDKKRSEKDDDALEDIHEFCSNLTLLLIVMHVTGVVLASVAHKENLVRAMVTGRKRLT